MADQCCFYNSVQGYIGSNNLYVNNNIQVCFKVRLLLNWIEEACRFYWVILPAHILGPCSQMTVKLKTQKFSDGNGFFS